MSRQREWAAKQVAAGNCYNCGRPRNRSRWRCDDCKRKQTSKKKAKRDAEKTLTRENP